MVRKAATPVWVRLLSVNNRWFSDQLFSCRDENRADPLLPSAFLSFLCIYFLVYALFFLVFYSVLGWCFRSWLCIFFGCVLFALFFWVDCSVFLDCSSPWC
jgi:hypothetical protein